MAKVDEIHRLFNEYLQDPRVDYKTSRRSARPRLDLEKPVSREWYKRWGDTVPEKYLWPIKTMRGFIGSESNPLLPLDRKKLEKRKDK